MSGSSSALEGSDPLSLPALFRRWKSMSVIACLCFAGACMYIRTITPLYKAETQILMPETMVEDPSDRRTGASVQTDALVVHSFSEVIQNNGICEMVIEALGLAKNPEFNIPPSRLSEFVASAKKMLGLVEQQTGGLSDADLRRDALVHEYKSRMKVVSEAKSLVLSLSFEAADPRLAADIVNAQADAFIKEQVRRRQDEAQVRNAWMKKELERAADEAKEAQNSLQLHFLNPSANHNASASMATEFKFRQVLGTAKQLAYEGLLAKYQAFIAEQRFDGSTIRILSPAIVPTKPSFPKKLLLASAAAFGSFFIGFFTVLVRQAVGDKPTLAQFAASRQLRVLGSLNIPFRRRMPTMGFKRGVRNALFWEQIRDIRTAIAGDDQGKVVAITSAESGEGKSLVAAALANSMAVGGARTLLLDLNLRNRSFYTPAEVEYGLGAYLRKECSITQASSNVDSSVPLYLLTRSRGDEISIDDLSGIRLKTLLSELRQSFEIIVVDTPAANIVVDAYVVAGLADEVVVVAREHETSWKQIDRTVKNFENRGIGIRGLVITDGERPSRDTCSRLRSYTKSQKEREIWPGATPSWTLIELLRRRPMKLLSVVTVPALPLIDQRQKSKGRSRARLNAKHVEGAAIVKVISASRSADRALR